MSAAQCDTRVSNPNFYLTRNQVVGFWEDGELRLLCKALRFPEDLLVSYIAQNSPEDKERISTKKLKSLIHQGLFFRLTDCTFNNHDAAFNVPALLRSIDTIEGRVVSFAELNSIYLAYATYEMVNMTGLPAEIDTLLATFKLCGKTISPAKLRHRLKHAKDTHVRSYAVQFDEFLNLLLWSLPDNFPLLPPLAPVKDQNNLGLYSVDDPWSYMLPSSERVQQELDRKFINDEMSYMSKQLRIGSPVIAEKRGKGVEFDEWTSALVLGAGISEDMIKAAKNTGAVVKNEVEATANELRTVKAGFEHTRDISKQWLIRETTPRSPSSRGPSRLSAMSGLSNESRMEDPIFKLPDLNNVSATEMYEILQAYMKEREHRLKGSRDVPEYSFISESPIKKTPVSKKSDPKEPLVTAADITETQATIKAMKVEQAFMQRRKLLQQPIEDDNGQGEDDSKRTVDELIAQLYNPPPLRFQSHDQQCDSKKRNIGQLNEPGIHFLLTEPSYEVRSPQGKRLASLHYDLIGHGKLRGKTVRIVNKSDLSDDDANKKAEQKSNQPEETSNRERAGSVGRAKSPVTDSNGWMAAFIGSNSVLATLNPVDMEQYYLRKMQEFCVPLPENTCQTNKTS